MEKYQAGLKPVRPQALVGPARLQLSLSLRNCQAKLDRACRASQY